MRNLSRLCVSVPGRLTYCVTRTLRASPALNLARNVHCSVFMLDSKKMENQNKTFMFVGLGNHDMPKSRHSVGMQAVDKLAHRLDVQFRKRKDCEGMVAEAQVNELIFVLLKPRKPMNANGKSVAKTARCFSVPADSIYLLHDDLERAVGKVTIKEKGSAGGHNGVKSVIASLRTDVIPRLRIGIDRPSNKDNVVEYVLQNFRREEQTQINKTLKEGLEKLGKHLEKRTCSDIMSVLAPHQSDSSTEQTRRPRSEKHLEQSSDPMSKEQSSRHLNGESYNRQESSTSNAHSNNETSIPKPGTSQE